MYICTYVCVYVCMYVCIYVCIYVCKAKSELGRLKLVKNLF